MLYFCILVFGMELKYPYKNLIYLLIIMLAFSCKEPEPPAPLPIPTPKFVLPQTQINLGEITSKSKGEFTFKKNGIGKISYAVTSNKRWLKLENFDGKLGLFLSDTIKFSTVLPSNDLIEGENIAILTVTPTINEVTQSPINVEVKGNYKATLMQVSTQMIDLGTIKTQIKTKFIITKTGLEDVSYVATSNKPWVNLNHSSGNITNPDTITVSLDPSLLSSGAFDGKITIVPKILGINGAPITINIVGIYDDTISGDIQGHTLLKDETWGGNINLNGTVIVPKGIKLVIKPGSIITVKKASSPISLTVFGKLFMNGNISNIIEMKSGNNTSSNADWAGLIINGDVELSYSVFKNAKNAVSFEFYSLSTSSLNPNIHHVLFDNCFVGIMDYQTNLESTINNLTFRNIELFSIVFSKFKNSTIESCEFLNETCYIDINISANNGRLFIKNTNFVQKKFGYQSQLEVISGNSFNSVSATNCYALFTKNGFGSSGNSFSASNVLSSPNQNIGCGFANKYVSSRKKSK